MLLNDEFESKLLLNYELSMDEQAERLRRAQVLDERLSDLKESISPEKVWIRCLFYGFLYHSRGRADEVSICGFVA